MNRNGEDIADAIRAEIRQWSGVSVEIEEPKRGHPRAVLSFKDASRFVIFPGTGDSERANEMTIKDVRKELRALGAERTKTTKSAKPARKENETGVKARPDPVSHEPVKGKPSMADQLKAATTEPSVIERAAAIVDGIYFDLPEEVYHSVPRLSASGLQRLCVSPATFWRGSWLDPECPEHDEEATKAQILGKAYHCARLEPDAFEARYARELSKDDFPEGTLFTGKDMEKVLAEKGLAKSGSVLEQAQRLFDGGFAATHLWHLALADWQANLGKRVPIAAKFYDDIERDMERLHGTKEIAELFEGGQSEVSIFYTDPHGIKMKHRLDRLCPDRWLDFKTFDNSRGKVLAQAIADAVRYNRIYVQAVSYRDGVEAVRTGGLQIQGKATDAQKKLIAGLQIRPTELDHWLIFQEKNGIPNLLARRFEFYAVDPYRQTEIDALVAPERKAEVEAALTRKTKLFQLAEMQIGWAKRQFVLYSQIYPPGRPWAPTEPCSTIGDIDFNSNWLEGKYE